MTFMKRIFFSIAFVCLLSSFLLSDSQAQPVSIVDEGVPSAQIIISSDASATETHVANDLQRIIQKISGAKLPIKNTIDKSTFNIVIGTPQSIPEIKSAELLVDNNEETIRIKTQGKVLFLAGNTPASALRATYTFLQDKLDARWYWPGDTGEYLPIQKTITIDEIDITETPDIDIRSLALNGPASDRKDTIIWMSRNRMNMLTISGNKTAPEQTKELHEKGIKARIGGHNITLPEDLLNEHPEYRALYAGKRQGDQLCWGNPEVRQAVADKIIAWWKDNPEVDSVSLMAADNTHFCDDELCKVFAPDISTRWQKFSKDIIERVDKVYPDKEYQTLSYQAYRNVPTEVAPFAFNAYTTYNINYTKPITDPSNIKARKEIEAWKDLGANIGIRGYQFIPFNRAMYAPIEPLIIDEIAWAAEKNLKGWYSELRPQGSPKGTPLQNQSWTANRMALYAVAQAMWNSKVNSDALTQEWAQRIFGVAAVPMNSYYKRMQSAWLKSSKGLTYFLQPPASFVTSFISEDSIQNAEKDFQKARANLDKETDSSIRNRIKDQIDLESAMFDNWHQVYLLQQGRADRFQIQAPLAITTPQVTADSNDSAWKNIIPLPDFEDKKMEAAVNSTKVLLQWDKDNLYLRFINEDNDISKLRTRGQEHDSNVFGDDAIEMFLDNPTQAGHYFHVAINADNVVYDSKSDAAMNIDKTWNAQFKSKTSIGEDSWILDVKFPFSTFGIDAAEGNSWKMSFKRNGAGKHPNTGWPDASYHNPAGFGTVEFVNRVVKKNHILTYSSGKSADVLLTAFRKHGFIAKDIPQKDEEFRNIFTEDADIVTLFYPSSGGFKLADDTVQELLVPFVKKGGLLVIAGSGAAKKLETWFGKDAAVKWSGWKISKPRKSTFVADGNWQKQPHDLSKALKGTSPSSGFYPQSDKWEVLGKIGMENGDDSSYLLRQKVGQGALVLTSSNFGYGGGFEMFGDKHTENIAKLISNLLADLRTDKN